MIFLTTDKQNISGGTTYLHKVPALVAIDNNANNRWCQSGFQLLTSPDNYVPSSGPVVLFVESFDEDDGYTYTTDISEAKYVRLSMNVLFNCNNIPGDFTSLTISQGNNIHTLTVTFKRDDDTLLKLFNVGSIVTINGTNSYLENDPIFITFNQ